MGAMTTPSTDSDISTFKPRKSHQKSRNGCLQCKQQRRKCDEGRPRCSRCSKRNISCRYATRNPRDLSCFSQCDLPTVVAGALGCPKASTLLGAGLPPCLRTNLSVADTLAAIEMSLLTRYLMHTSHIIPADNDDVFALQVGIPNLAFSSAPLMDSILALAAVCQCREIVGQPNISRQDWNQLGDLLALADHHYASSLHQIQENSSDPAHYEHVLANATIMVLYGSANHSLRIRIAKSVGSDDRVANKFPPVPMQWMSLIRAAHMAYSGLLHCRKGFEGAGAGPSSGEDTSSSPRGSSMPMLASSLPLDGSHDGSTGRTRSMIRPIIVATSSAALERLDKRLQSTRILLGGASCMDSEESLIEVCSEALVALHDNYDALSSGHHSSTSIEDGDISASLPPCGLSTVAPWLRSYVARVTSSVPQKPLRRKITSFLNRVPLAFLDLIRSTLDEKESIHNASKPMIVRLAMDIFAHWLVLVTSLDGVWWIAGIGEWELGRVVEWSHQHDPVIRAGEEWWPEKILNVRKELLDEVMID